MGSLPKFTRVLLVDANDMTKPVGGGVFEVHPPLGLMYMAAYPVLKRKIRHRLAELIPADLR